MFTVCVKLIDVFSQPTVVLLLTVLPEAEGQVSKFPVLKVYFSGWRSSRMVDECMAICCLVGL